MRIKGYFYDTNISKKTIHDKFFYYPTYPFFIFNCIYSVIKKLQGYLSMKSYIYVSEKSDKCFTWSNTYAMNRVLALLGKVKTTSS